MCFTYKVAGLSFGLALLMAPMSNYISTRFGFKHSMVLGIFLFCGGQIAAAFASQVWHLFITLGVMFGTGKGFIFIAILPLASQWFDHKRAMASGLSPAGSGVGGLIFSITMRIITEKTFNQNGPRSKWMHRSHHPNTRHGFHPMLVWILSSVRRRLNHIGH